MKLSFTTLGCPDWDMQTIVSHAKAYGFDGIDFRGYRGTMDIYELPEFSTQWEATKALIDDHGLEVSCFSSSVHLVSEEKLERNLHEIEQFAKLCKQFGASYIRVFGGKIGDMDRTKATETVMTHLSQMCDIVRQYEGVKIILETHDDWTSCVDVKSIMDQADHQFVAVLWDIHHPFRTLNEQPQDTWRMIGKWVEYTHWKDSRTEGLQNGSFQYCLMGEGDIPFTTIYDLLLENGYDGWFTLEWEKKWHPHIEEPEVAFPQYIQYMRQLAESRATGHS